jgi:LPS-assembly lipoprotein
MAARSPLVIATSLALALVLPGLSACAGFTPVYARPAAAAGLSRIAVTAPETRTGFLLRQDLEDALARDRTAPAA